MILYLTRRVEASAWPTSARVRARTKVWTGGSHEKSVQADQRDYGIGSQILRALGMRFDCAPSNKHAKGGG